MHADGVAVDRLPRTVIGGGFRVMIGLGAGFVEHQLPDGDRLHLCLLLNSASPHVEAHE